MRKYPENTRYKVQLEITEITYELQKLEPLLKSKIKQLNLETNWMLSEGIPLDDILDAQILEVASLYERYKSLKTRFGNR